jgi:hypothetical protein
MGCECSANCEGECIVIGGKTKDIGRRIILRLILEI